MEKLLIPIKVISKWKNKFCAKCGKEIVLKSGSQKFCKECSIISNERIKKLCDVYYNMNKRCSDKSARDYKWYGGKGIIVNTEWASDIKNFLNWALQNGYKRGLQLDRINPVGNYEPDNCRFVTCKENQNNRTNKVTFGNYRICLYCKIKKELCEFHRNGKDFHYICKICRNESRRKKQKNID